MINSILSHSLNIPVNITALLLNSCYSKLTWLQVYHPLCYVCGIKEFMFRSIQRVQRHLLVFDFTRLHSGHFLLQVLALLTFTHRVLYCWLTVEWVGGWAGGWRRGQKQSNTQEHRCGHAAMLWSLQHVWIMGINDTTSPRLGWRYRRMQIGALSKIKYTHEG